MSTTIHTINLGITNAYLLCGKQNILIEAASPRKAKALAKALGELSIPPEDIKLIVPTHGHWDHIGSAHAFKELTGAPIALHETEADWLENGRVVVPPGVTTWGRIFGTIMRAGTRLVRIETTSVDVRLGNDEMRLDEFGINGVILHTPGHTAGSVSILLDSGDAFVGDSAMNGLPLRRGPGLPIFAEDMDALKRSWVVLVERGAQTVYPAHGKPFPVDIIKTQLDAWPG